MLIELQGLKNLSIKNGKFVAALIREILSKAQEFDKDKEHFFVIGLTRANKVKYIDLVSLGSLHGVVVEPREVFRVAVHKAAAALILAHNHPSNNHRPSNCDKTTTKELVAAGKILHIQVFDHVIVCDRSYYSFAEGGLL